ncbi:carbohydrate ABC transporter permease [Anaerococcus sp. NML200574]|uniref:Carbohydrate ABC transporter permease n=1 Tax=Anaerococcus kampingae TaxID=3115614 RepID=A0ABW9MFJ0_9FIRM|nr:MULTISPECIES: carbohydrate ABC transporter permease [Anaerococcus]MCW6679366.1 carbohydrate ABC transporter permease [Anaerococcus sp. NML200574]
MQIKGYKKIILHFLLILGVIFTVFPFLWMILTALKTLSESMAIPPKIFPASPQWSNFKEALNTINFPTLFKNTVIYAVVTTIGQVTMCTMAGYSFARIEFPFKNAIFVLIMSVLMVPTQIFLVPQFQIINKLGLLNTITALILPSMFSAFGTFLMRQFFSQIPKELEEAARIDGSGQFKIFKDICLPIVKPGIVTLVITCLLFTWNNLMWPLIVNTLPEKMTLSVGLANLSATGHYAVNYPVYMASALIAIWPMILLFAIFQKQFIESLASSGMKG